MMAMASQGLNCANLPSCTNQEPQNCKKKITKNPIQLGNYVLGLYEALKVMLMRLLTETQIINSGTL